MKMKSGSTAGAKPSRAAAEAVGAAASPAGAETNPAGAETNSVGAAVDRPSINGSFTLRFAIALLAGLVAAVLISPAAADAVGAMGFRFPFPRIFDRTVMVTLLAAMLLGSRAMRFWPLIRTGFAAPHVLVFAPLRRIGLIGPQTKLEPAVNAPAIGEQPISPSIGERGNRLTDEHATIGVAVRWVIIARVVAQVTIGLAIALMVIAILFALALVDGAAGAITGGALVLRAAEFILPAIVIGVIEEGFFRAFLLSGMRRDFGPRGALIASSAFYAAAHLVRSPKHYYATGFHADAGLSNLAASAAQLGHPIIAAPMLIGLFLLGMVLGKAFLLTGTVWFSVGLHAGLVIGAKIWRLFAHGDAPVSRWIAGPGPVPLIAAPAAWMIAIALLVALPRILGVKDRNSSLYSE